MACMGSVVILRPSERLSAQYGTSPLRALSCAASLGDTRNTSRI
jgi:hypothetical protein